VRAGRLKALASGAAKRPHIASDVPTIAEAAVPDFDNSIWFGLMAPVATPRDVVDKLAAAANKALKEKDIADKLMAAGFEPLGGSPAAFAQVIARDYVRWGDAAKAAGMKK
jgi:tripartite-type tricarboxylate transporter receptor subunit TctC